MTTRIRYALSMPDPSSHLLHVRMEARGLPGETTDFVLPVWTPGSYKVRDFARNVQDFSAGKLPWKKIDKSRWRVFGGGNVTIEYRVWAFELTVQTSHLDDEHAFVNGASLFFYVDGHKDAPVHLDIRAPRGWETATGLERRGRSWTAPDYDVLVDSPLEIGRFRRHAFRVRGVAHALVVHGPSNANNPLLLRDVKKIVAAEISIMRHVPYRNYTFILHNTFERGGGGLEHLNSTALQVRPDAYRPREKYEDFLTLVAHEFWHLWNVKRIRPEALGPFDYEKEVYTSLLWVMEGITSYYDTLVPRRAGLLPPKRYLKRVAERIRKYEEKPGRKRQSLSESSFDTWIKLYQPNENAPNAQMSYYEKGELVGLCLDLEIRRRTRNRRSLDDVMRLLYTEHARRGRGFPETAFKAACERIAGNLDRFFADYVDGRAEIPWNRFLGAAGLRLKEEPRKPEEGEAAPARIPWLGAAVQRTGALLSVTSVVEGSPAARAGLSAKDEIVAVDGAKVNPEEWEKRLLERAPGESIRLAVFRGGYLRELTVRLGKRPNTAPVIRPVPRPSPLQRRTYEGWLGADWEARP